MKKIVRSNKNIEHSNKQIENNCKRNKYRWLSRYVDKKTYKRPIKRTPIRPIKHKHTYTHTYTTRPIKCTFIAFQRPIKIILEPNPIIWMTLKKKKKQKKKNRSLTQNTLLMV